MPAHEGPRLDVFVVLADEERRDRAIVFVGELRELGLATDIDLGDRSVKSQFRTADRREARTVVVVGEEWSEGRVTVKDLATGEQTVIAKESVVDWVLAR
jgi:histidyl-tRNA synthetase